MTAKGRICRMQRMMSNMNKAKNANGPIRKPAKCFFAGIYLECGMACRYHKHGSAANETQ